MEPHACPADQRHRRADAFANHRLRRGTSPTRSLTQMQTTEYLLCCARVSLRSTLLYSRETLPECRLFDSHPRNAQQARLKRWGASVFVGMFLSARDSLSETHLPETPDV